MKVKTKVKMEIKVNLSLFGSILLREFLSNIQESEILQVLKRSDIEYIAQHDNAESLYDFFSEIIVNLIEKIDDVKRLIELTKEEEQNERNIK